MKYSAIKKTFRSRKFCVIDDKSFDLYSLQDYLVTTDTEYGLQDEHIEQAKKY